MTQPLRCAIYTRKSTEEGLEQGFNSLHAQREACEAYVLFQAGEGWSALPTTYDDGGYSGGSVERPGIQSLLTDIRRGLIDVVVVYKVDRLTRALGDFARMVELFDEHKVSFVSVTQAFNTTTSMGRLTLNVLLSFAQFEREVTGERIRDKIAQSKAKGMWMGGRPPFGYDGVERKLVINPEEAQCVRHIFQRFLEVSSVLALAAELRIGGVTSKRWINKRGEPAGGGAWTRGALYYLLANPVYRGAIRHKTRLYADAHAAVIDEATWIAVQEKRAANCPGRPPTPRLAADVLLRGLLFDDRGSPMSPVHTTRGAARYRYYAVDRRDAERVPGSLPRIAMGRLDTFVIDQVTPLLSRGCLADAPITDRIQRALARVTIGEDQIAVILHPDTVISDITERCPGTKRLDIGIELRFAIRLKHRKGEAVTLAVRSGAPAPRLDRPLIRAVCLARSWADQLSGGESRSVRDLAIKQGLCNHYASRMMPLAWLAPDLVTLIMEGRQPVALSLSALMRDSLPLDWDAQRKVFETLG